MTSLRLDKGLVRHNTDHGSALSPECPALHRAAKRKLPKSQKLPLVTGRRLVVSYMNSGIET